MSPSPPVPMSLSSIAETARYYGRSDFSRLFLFDSER